MYIGKNQTILQNNNSPNNKPIQERNKNYCKKFNVLFAKWICPFQDYFVISNMCETKI